MNQNGQPEPKQEWTDQFDTLLKECLSEFEKRRENLEWAEMQFMGSLPSSIYAQSKKRLSEWFDQTRGALSYFETRFKNLRADFGDSQRTGGT